MDMQAPPLAKAVQLTVKKRRNPKENRYQPGSALSIPMVLEMVFCNLERRDLVSCAQVNHDWNEIAERALRKRGITLRLADIGRYLIRLRDGGRLHSSIRLKFRKWNEVSYSEKHAIVDGLSKIASSVRTLHLEYHPFPCYNNELDANDLNYYPFTLLEIHTMLTTLAPFVTSLSVAVNVDYNTTPRNLSSVFDAFNVIFHSVTRLVVIFRKGFDISLWTPIRRMIVSKCTTEYCPNATELGCSFQDWMSACCVLDLLPGSRVDLLTAVEIPSTGSIGKLLRCNPPLSRIRLCYDFRDAGDVQLLLNKFAETITHLSLSFNLWQMSFQPGVLTRFAYERLVPVALPSMPKLEQLELFRFGSINYLHDFLPAVVFTYHAGDKLDECFPSLKKIAVSENIIQKLIVYLKKLIPLENAQFSFVTNVDFLEDLAVTRNPPSPDRFKWLSNTFPNAKLGTMNSNCGENQLCEENKSTQLSADVVDED